MKKTDILGTLFGAVCVVAIIAGATAHPESEPVPVPAVEQQYPECFPKYEVYDPFECEVNNPTLHAMMQKICSCKWTRHLCH